MESMEEQLSCPICLELFNDPKCMPCGHSICGTCVLGLAHRHYQCPLCRAQIYPDLPGLPPLQELQLPTNVNLKSIVDQHKASANAHVYAVCKGVECEKSAGQTAAWKLEDFWICGDCEFGVFCSTCAIKTHSAHKLQSYVEYLAPKYKDLSAKHSQLVENVALLHDRRKWIKETSNTIDKFIQGVTRLREAIDRFDRSVLECELNGIDEQIELSRAMIEHGRLAKGGWALPFRQLEELEAQLTTGLPNRLVRIDAKIERVEHGVKAQPELNHCWASKEKTGREKSAPNGTEKPVEDGNGKSGDGASSSAGENSKGKTAQEKSAQNGTVKSPQNGTVKSAVNERSQIDATTQTSDPVAGTMDSTGQRSISAGQIASRRASRDAGNNSVNISADMECYRVAWPKRVKIEPQ